MGYDNVDIEPDALDLEADANNVRPEAGAVVETSLYDYFEFPMTDTDMVNFSLVKKIHNRLRAKEQHSPDWRPISRSEAEKDEMLYRLVFAKHRVEQWTPTEDSRD